MAGTQADFWGDVREARLEVAASITKQKEQPHNGKSCFIVSKRNRGDAHELRAGHVSECSITLAGQRLVENTHELATDEQIVAHRNEEAGRKIEIGRLEQARKNQFLAEPLAAKA